MRAPVLMVIGSVLLAAVAVCQDSLSGAMEAYRKGDFRTAARLFSAAAESERDPAARAEIRIKLAWTHFGLKNRAKAEEALAAALADDPQHELIPDLYTDEFLVLFNRIKQRRPSEPRAQATPPPAARAATGSIAGLRARLAQAIDNAELESIYYDVQQLEAATPAAGLPEVLELRVETLERLGRASEALEQRGRLAALRAAAQSLPGTPVVPLEALLEARRHLAAGRPQDAEAILRGVLATLPSSVQTLEVLGEALLEGGKLDEAHSALRTAMLGNEKPELWLLLGEVELKRGRLPGARDAFRRALDNDSGNDRAWTALGLLAARMDDLATAREALDKALQSNGALFEARVVRAQLALADGQTAVAIGHLQRALQVRPNDAWASGWLGVAQLAAGHPQPAIELLGPAQKADAFFTLALAEALRRNGQAEEALRLVGTARPGREGAFLRARVLLDGGRAEEAESILRELAAENPTDARIRYLLGYALHAGQKWDEAAVELAQAAALAGAPPQAQTASALAQASLAATQLMDSALRPPPPLPAR